MATPHEKREGEKEEEERRSSTRDTKLEANTQEA